MITLTVYKHPSGIAYVSQSELIDVISEEYGQEKAETIFGYIDADNVNRHDDLLVAPLVWYIVARREVRPSHQSRSEGKQQLCM
ncbi:TPA: hypothetical protein ACX3FR_004175 [Vibrio parahaemolyticus]